MEAASDDWFVDADDDGFADMAIVGRLPARSDAQLAAMVSKIIAYEQGAGGELAALGPPGVGSRRRRGWSTTPH